MKKIKIFIVFLIICTCFIFSEKEKLSYEVSVQSQVLPFFVTDKAGNPVYDLKKEDIKLIVNGKETAIIDLIDYKFFRSINRPGNVRQTTKAPVRYVFIIIDEVFNSLQGLKRADHIIRKMYHDSSVNDYFLILKVTPSNGVKYVCGPTRDKFKIYTSLYGQGKISHGEEAFLSSVNNQSQSSGTENVFEESLFGSGSEISADKLYKEMMARVSTNEYLNIKARLKVMRNTMMSLRLALKTITRTKTAYFFSQGVANSTTQGGRGNFVKNKYVDPLFFYEMMQEIAKAFNRGGTILNVVDTTPQNLKMKSLMSSRDIISYLASEGGGNYYRGSDINKIVNKISRSSAAYYELFYKPEFGMKKAIKVKIKSGDRNLKITAVKYTELNRKYRNMEQKQKELFAFNAVSSGSWSRQLASVKETKIKYFKSSRVRVKFRMFLTDDFQDKKLDVFTLLISPDTLKTDFHLQVRKGRKSLNFNKVLNYTKKMYVVVIEPQTAKTLYVEVDPRKYKQNFTDSLTGSSNMNNFNKKP